MNKYVFQEDKKPEDDYFGEGDDDDYVDDDDRDDGHDCDDITVDEEKGDDNRLSIPFKGNGIVVNDKYDDASYLSIPCDFLQPERVAGTRITSSATTGDSAYHLPGSLKFVKARKKTIKTFDYDAPPFSSRRKEGEEEKDFSLVDLDKLSYNNENNKGFFHLGFKKKDRKGKRCKRMLGCLIPFVLFFFSSLLLSLFLFLPLYFKNINTTSNNSFIDKQYERTETSFENITNPQFLNHPINITITPSLKYFKDVTSTPSLKHPRNTTVTPSLKHSKNVTSTPSLKHPRNTTVTPSLKHSKNTTITPSLKHSKSNTITNSLTDSKTNTVTLSLEHPRTTTFTPSSKYSKSNTIVNSLTDSKSNTFTPSSKHFRNVNTVTPSSKHPRNVITVTPSSKHPRNVNTQEKSSNTITHLSTKTLLGVKEKTRTKIIKEELPPIKVNITVVPPKHFPLFKPPVPFKSPSFIPPPPFRSPSFIPPAFVHLPKTADRPVIFTHPVL